jgi:hypothetical protein
MPPFAATNELDSLSFDENPSRHTPQEQLSLRTLLVACLVWGNSFVQATRHILGLVFCVHIYVLQRCYGGSVVAKN